MAVVAHLVRQAFHEVGFHVVEVHAILWALRTGQGGHDVVEVELQHSGVGFLSGVLAAPETLRLGVGFNAGHGVILAPRQTKVIEGALVHREKPTGGAVFRRHVGDGGPIGQRKRLHANTEELDKFPDHAVFTQHLNDAQRHVGGGDAGLKTARQSNTDDIGSEHVDGLTEHDGFGFNTTNAPAEHAQTVDHRGV